MGGWIWFLMGFAGLSLLGIGLYYGQYKTSHPPHTRGEDLRRDVATRELYHEEDEREARQEAMRR
jgi:hypothetical protein